MPIRAHHIDHIDHIDHIFPIMSINFNSELLDHLPESLALAQRALYYGDSLFETIRVFNGRIPFMRLHWGRLSEGLQRMGYSVPTDWSADYFKHQIQRIAPANARVRWMVWRSPGGLYRPTDDTPQFLLTVQELDSSVFDWNTRGLSIGLCRSVRLPMDALSGLKAPNAFRYVAAMQEADAHGWDDAVLLNACDRLCEATSSNIFWIKNGTVCTPPLSEGPVTGVARGLLPGLTEAVGLRFEEQIAGFEVLLTADEVFLTNAVRGIQWVRSCEEKVYDGSQTNLLHQELVRYVDGFQAGFY